jgi:hypothetical protein
MLIVGGEFIHANLMVILLLNACMQNVGDVEVIIDCVNICIVSSHMFMHS